VGDQPQYHEDEEDAGDVHIQHQEAQVGQGAQAVLADSERHGAESAEGGEVHDHVNHAEKAVTELIQDLHQGLGLFPQMGQGQTEEHGEQQHLDNFPLGEGVHHAVGDNVHEEIHRALMGGGFRVVGDALGVQGVGIHVHAGTGFEHIYHHQTDGQGHGGHGFKVNQGFQTHPAHFPHIPHLGNAHHHGGENDRGDHHLDQLDEGVPQGFHGGARIRVEGSETDPQGNGKQHLEVKTLVNRPMRHRSSCY